VLFRRASSSSVASGISPSSQYGPALPALDVAADPAAARDVRPDLVEVAGQAGSLGLKLGPEPAGRAHLPERQRLERPGQQSRDTARWPCQHRSNETS
jgi:hypothetical protein